MNDRMLYSYKTPCLSVKVDPAHFPWRIVSEDKDLADHAENEVEVKAKAAMNNTYCTN